MRRALDTLQDSITTYLTQRRTKLLALTREMRTQIERDLRIEWSNYDFTIRQGRHVLKPRLPPPAAPAVDPDEITRTVGIAMAEQLKKASME